MPFFPHRTTIICIPFLRISKCSVYECFFCLVFFFLRDEYFEACSNIINKQIVRKCAIYYIVYDSGMVFYNVLILKRYTFYSVCVCVQAFASLGPQRLALGLLCPQPFEILYFKIFCKSNVAFSSQQKHVHGHIKTSQTMQLVVQ